MESSIKLRIKQEIQNSKEEEVGEEGSEVLLLWRHYRSRWLTSGHNYSPCLVDLNIMKKDQKIISKISKNHDKDLTRDLSQRGEERSRSLTFFQMFEKNLDLFVGRNDGSRREKERENQRNLIPSSEGQRMS